MVVGDFWQQPRRQLFPVTRLVLLSWRTTRLSVHSISWWLSMYRLLCIQRRKFQYVGCVIFLDADLLPRDLGRGDSDCDSSAVGGCASNSRPSLRLCSVTFPITLVPFCSDSVKKENGYLIGSFSCHWGLVPDDDTTPIQTRKNALQIKPKQLMAISTPKDDRPQLYTSTTFAVEKNNKLKMQVKSLLSIYI